MSSRLSFSYFLYCHLCLLVVSALFHFCLSNENTDHVLCMDDERQALLRFKHGLVDETNRLASWVAEDRECCKWVGIACDNSTGHVDQIHLPGYCVGYYNTEKEYEEKLKCMLKGDISSSLLDLKQLKHLDLSCNNFGGIEVPGFIGSLENLRYLNLSYSIFGEIIPPQIGNLSELQVLCLGTYGYTYNYDTPTSMMNMRWLSSLGKLHHLDMSGMDLRKATDWLQVISTLPSLVQLHLSNCGLSNIYPHVHSFNFSSLSLLDLSYNRFASSLPQWIFSITSLVSLDLSYCGFYSIAPSNSYSFRNMTSLELLHVPLNYFMDSSLVLKGLSGSNLISLDISNCGISSSLLDSLQNLTSILSLRLSSNLLTKKIPKSFGNLCNLREIDMSCNNLGNISLTYLLESFFECKSPALESLSLSENYIIGIIPHSIGQLSFMRILDLRKNKIDGPIPYSIERLSSLELLDLSSNQLNGSLHDKIRRLSSLTIVDLSRNQLDGSLPVSLGKLSNLIYLAFSHNLLTGIVTEAHFANLISLIHLDGSSNNLTLRLQVENWIPPSSMEYLYLKSWVLGPQFPLWLQSQKELRKLDISKTKISSPMPESFFGSFHKLSYLNISNNHIQGTLALLSIPATIKAVDLGTNEFWGSLHPLLCSGVVKETMHLNLGNNYLSGVIPECLEKWPNLGFLNMENNNLSGEIPRTLGSASHLQILILRGNKISGRLPASLMNLTSLKILQLGKNKLVGSIPTWIGTKLTYLILLNLRSNNFYGNIPNELCYLRNLQIFDLANNNLSGNIPRCFNNISVLSGIRFLSGYQYSPPFGTESIITSDSLVMKGREDTYSTILGLVKLLDLSSNNLVGHIPSELTYLRELNSLNLSRNHLSGRIPEKIGDMKELISFDLSVNMLSGELPTSLTKLNFLSSFNVSYNNLTGRIPTSTQIQSLNESSFFGNKLCGAPLIETNDCAQVEVPRDAIRNKKADVKEDWGLIISILIGIFTGFWMIMGPLIVSRSWRIAYFRLLSKPIKVCGLCDV